MTRRKLAIEIKQMFGDMKHLNYLSEAGSARAKGVLVLEASLGPAKVRGDSNTGALVKQVLNGGDGSPDTGVISDGLAIQRNVEVATDEDLLALKLSLGEVRHRLLLHGHLWKAQHSSHI
jgi:hypothetical protein